MVKARASRAAAVAATAFISLAANGAYPERPVRMIVLNPPGGVSDVSARIVGEQLQKRWGQQIVVDNRVGASGIIGSEIAAKATPDGHTLLLGFVGSLAINPGLFRKLPYDPQKDFTAVSLVSRSPIVLAVNPGLPAKNVPELVALAKAQPGKLAYSSSGNGNGNHLATELFATMAGIELLHVPFRGGPPGITAVIGNRTQLMFGNAAFTVPQVKAGRVRAIAVTTESRLPALPDVPTVAESGYPDYVVTTWFGIVAPRGTPDAIVRKINAAVVDVLKDGRVQKTLDSAGLIPAPSTPQAFAELIRTETVRWRKVIEQTGAKVD